MKCNILFHMSSNVRNIIISFLAVILNFITATLFYQILGIPLFFDTIWTVAVVFYLGLIPGLCVSIGYNALNLFVWIIKTGTDGLFVSAYSICGILIVLSTWYFAKNKEEFKISPAITILYLVLITLVSSFCTIITGGTIDYFQYKLTAVPDQMNPIRAFTDSFIRQHFNLFASCILAQIPISFLDRLIATFAGYGIFRLSAQLEKNIVKKYE